MQWYDSSRLFLSRLWEQTSLTASLFDLSITNCLQHHATLASGYISKYTDDLNRYLGSYPPWQLVLFTVFALLLLLKALAVVENLVVRVREKGVLYTLAAIVFDLPIIRGIVEQQQSESIAKLRASIKRQRATSGGDGGGADTIISLPREGISASSLKARMGRRASKDIWSGNKMSGCIYMAGKAHQTLLNEVYKMFTLTNPLHSDAFPSVRKMEAEVVAMTASLLGGGPAGDPGVCGAMTGGGSESILTAVLASRNYMAARRGVTQPEMIIAESAHAAYFKAAEYFGIRLIRLPVDKEHLKLSARQVARGIRRNTILVVASAPGFPHGVMDDVEGIAAVCRRRGVLLHVDCCLGGFFLPFARDLGCRIPPSDFSVPGVTSMSIDTHKFGQSHKGTSVVLYRSADIRRFQYTQVTEWTGGLYISPGFAGSRSGALIATAWASLMHLGRTGFMEATANMLDLSHKFQEGIASIAGLEVMGEPIMSVVAFKSSHPKVNIWEVNDLMSARGWHLNALQRPPAVHMCFTPAHGPHVVAELLKDLKECVQLVLEHSKDGARNEEGVAPLYGQASMIPDRRIVGRFLSAYQDMMLEL